MAQPMLTFIALMSVSCNATSEPPCTDADFQAAFLQHEADLVKACGTAGDKCSERAKIDADYHNRLQQLVNCQR